MQLKNWWFFISDKSFAPILKFWSLLSNFVIRSYASGGIGSPELENVTWSSLRILSKVKLYELPLKGVEP